jgi:hypothetical protein
MELQISRIPFMDHTHLLSIFPHVDYPPVPAMFTMAQAFTSKPMPSAIVADIFKLIHSDLGCLRSQLLTFEGAPHLSTPAHMTC